MKEYSKGIYVKFKPEEVEILHQSDYRDSNHSSGNRQITFIAR